MRAAGYSVPDAVVNRASGWLADGAAATEGSDFETKAVLRARAGCGRARRVHWPTNPWERPSLTRRAGAGLSYGPGLRGDGPQVERPPSCWELLACATSERLAAAGGRRSRRTARFPATIRRRRFWRRLSRWPCSGLATASPKAKELVEWLLAPRRTVIVGCRRRRPARPRGLSRGLRKNRFQKRALQADRVGQRNPLAGQSNVDPAAAVRTIEVPSALLVKGKQRVSFRLTGRRTLHLPCVLGGFVPAAAC